MAHPISRIGIFPAIIVAQSLPAFAGAPRQLYNKTIQVNWTVDQVARTSSGQSVPRNIAVSHTIYVSSEGRLFERGSRSSGRASRTSENAPGASATQGGESMALRFVGNRIVGDTAFARGARHWEVNFDSSFSSCTVTVVFGKESGGMKRVGITGEMLTFESMKATSTSCSIRDGNPFANG